MSAATATLAAARTPAAASALLRCRRSLQVSAPLRARPGIRAAPGPRPNHRGIAMAATASPTAASGDPLPKGAASFFRTVISNMEKVYLSRNPTAKTILELVLSYDGDHICYDHFAFRTFGVDGYGINSLAEFFTDFGYVPREELMFPAKKLRALWFSPPTNDCYTGTGTYGPLPRIFISELLVDELTAQSQEIIHKYIKTSGKGNKHAALASTSGELTWEKPIYSDFQILSRESEYAAWTLVNGYALNHATISTHRLQSDIRSINKFNKFVEDNGFKLNTVIHEPMDDLPAEPEPEHDQDPVQEDPAPAAEEPRGAAAAAASPAVDHEADAEVDSSGDSSERKAVSMEDDAVADGHHTDQGSQGEQSLSESYPICSDHEECIARPERIKIQKGFVAKESVKGHMVNVVKGLKIYEDVFTTSEIMKVADFINEIRQAGRNGELSGETFIFFNKQIKGNKREIIQLGVPLFQSTTEEANCHIEPIPVVLQAVIDHLVLWRLIPESRKPNSVIVNFFDEDEHSQPYFKPPHLDNPISTLLLSETTMAFGRSLVTDSNGNYKGPLTLSLKQGSLLVMRGNSADMARHVVCPSSNRRVSITFARVRQSTPVDLSPLPSPTKAMTPWQPQPATVAPVGMAQKPHGGGGAIIGYAPAPQAMLAPAAWGMAVRAPVMMVAAAPARPMVMAASGGGVGGGANKRMGRSGTGVFLPWTVGPKRYNKHLPPRIQKRRFSAMMSPIEAQG